jgi:hypothetical protein
MASLDYCMQAIALQAMKSTQVSLKSQFFTRALDDYGGTRPAVPGDEYCRVALRGECLRRQTKGMEVVPNGWIC